MKLKKFLRKVFLVLYWVTFGVLLTLSIQGRLSILYRIALIVDFIYLAVILWGYIIRRVCFCTLFKQYKELFKCLIYIHNERYKILLNGGDNPEMEKCSKLFEECTSRIINKGPELMKDEMALAKERKEIEDIIKKSQKLTTTVIPQYDT